MANTIPADSVGSMPAQGVEPDRALPGRRMARRIDSNFGMVSPFGGQGDGRNDKGAPLTPAEPRSGS